MTFTPAKFTEQEADRASEEWGCNCGPGALAAVLGITLDEVRPLIPQFEERHYTNPTMMRHALGRTRARWMWKALAPGESERMNHSPWPRHGLARVQWEGPWTEDGVPIKARYRMTHWVGACTNDDRNTGIFDINCMHVGGWVPLSAWAEHIVPWILREAVPRANGKWHLTHVIEVTP